MTKKIRRSTLRKLIDQTLLNNSTATATQRLKMTLAAEKVTAIRVSAWRLGDCACPIAVAYNLPDDIDYEDAEERLPKGALRLGIEFDKILRDKLRVGTFDVVKVTA
jgi:hypothetical protein